MAASPTNTGTLYLAARGPRGSRGRHRLDRFIAPLIGAAMIVGCSSAKGIPGPTTNRVRPGTAPTANAPSTPTAISASIQSETDAALLTGLIEEASRAVVATHNAAVSLERAVVPIDGAVTLAVSASRTLDRVLTQLDKAQLSQSELAHALRAFQTLAAEVSAGAAKLDRILSSTFVSRLSAADASWATAISAINRRLGLQLGVSMPPLLMPSGDRALPPTSR